MKRRSFLATVAGLVAAPFVAKKAAAAVQKTKPYFVAVDWARDSVKLPDHHVEYLLGPLKPDGTRDIFCPRVVSNNPAKQAEAMKELEKFFGKAHYQTLAANMRKTP